MKYYNRILLLAMVVGITVSCADALFADYKTEKPESLKKYEYLNEYGDLKTYIVSPIPTSSWERESR